MVSISAGEQSATWNVPHFHPRPLRAAALATLGRRGYRTIATVTPYVTVVATIATGLLVAAGPMAAV
ncbi:hypothetical protein JGU71_15835 [Antrihabitans sp. YC3-6]|uniref:Uncharacterized protein n=1 Tax=Antrihabitans stalagmiti TaxID=2799499 RepID=A0A934NS81_9NOCA|nr:hypothetical protein [Antrihabitans stalagmiti]MBJ8340362.1 hypothetical protein [Antrihabitans stalagmiti]